MCAPQIYLDGEFVAAVLDDIVMQPLTGKLKAVLYRYYTPGEHSMPAALLRARLPTQECGC
jgi:hypothetical protein